MNNNEFELKAIEIVQSIINYISQKRYDKLSSVAMIEISWCGDSEDQEEGFREFGEWIDGQLALWSEDEGKEFVVDPYERQYLDLGELEDGCFYSTYSPTNHGEKLDFWFEIDICVNDNEEVIAELNVNI